MNAELVQFSVLTFSFSRNNILYGIIYCFFHYKLSLFYRGQIYNATKNRRETFINYKDTCNKKKIKKKYDDRKFFCWREVWPFIEKCLSIFSFGYLFVFVFYRCIKMAYDQIHQKKYKYKISYIYVNYFRNKRSNRIFNTKNRFYLYILCYCECVLLKYQIITL